MNGSGHMEFKYPVKTSVRTAVRNGFELFAIVVAIILPLAVVAFTTLENKYIDMGDSYVWSNRHINMVVSLLVRLLAYSLNELFIHTIDFYKFQSLF